MPEPRWETMTTTKSPPTARPRKPAPSRPAIGRRLDSAIAALPEEFREVVILRELEEMSYRDIAAATGAPIGTVMSRLARGRALLREKLIGRLA